MERTQSVFDRWIQDNNEVVNKCQQEVFNRDHNQAQHLRWCSSEFHKLLKKIQGIPLHVDHAQLELAVVYNVCLCSIAQCQFSEVELLLTQATKRVLCLTGQDADTSDLAVRWRTVLTLVGYPALQPCIRYIFCLQWALWLATNKLKALQEYQEQISSLYIMLCGEVEDSKAEGKLSNFPRLMMDPRRLVELLQSCTTIVLGAEKLAEGCSSEALSGLQAASSLPAPRALVAYTHLLSGSCLSHMSRPQMALQCYSKALETDSRCVFALYQSLLIYRQLGNTQAEIQALRLMHATLMLPSATQPTLAATHLLSPSLFLSSRSLCNLLSVPSALSILHSLALKCVIHGRVSEGVEHYLDLLAALYSEDQTALRDEVHTLPRLPELYLEAGAALLKAQRPADCLALCNEVISTTLEVLPERVVLVEPKERSKPESKDDNVHGDDKVKMLLWTAASYLLQGHSHTHHKDWKLAVTHYTRCIHLLVKVRFKKTGCEPQIPSSDIEVNCGLDLCVLQRLKGLSLAGRGISFCQIHQLKEALRDLQLSLQAFPECAEAGLWCGEVLWRLDRRREAAACWEKTWSISPQPSDETLPLYLQELWSAAVLDSTELRRRIKELGPT